MADDDGFGKVIIAIVSLIIGGGIVYLVMKSRAPAPAVQAQEVVYVPEPQVQQAITPLFNKEDWVVEKDRKGRIVRISGNRALHG